MNYLRNTWYVAAWTHEIDHALFARTLLDIPIVMYRLRDRRAVALHDECPHRFAPLSMGSVIDDKVRCGYHGLEFESTGRCVGTCLNYVAPKAAKVRTFPLFEQDNLIWIWMGDEPPADPSTIVRFPQFTNPAMRSVYGSMVAQVDYRLVSDNLMDLTHAALLHPIFGGLNYQPKFRSWEDGDEVTCEYTSEAPSSMIVGDTPVVGVDTIRWRAPGVHSLVTRITPKDPAFEAAEFPAAHIVTPETMRSTHYFWGASIEQHSPITNDHLKASLQHAFDNEDKPMLEAVQRRMGDLDLFEKKPLLLSVDSGAVRVRRKLAAMIELETAARNGSSVVA